MNRCQRCGRWLPTLLCYGCGQNLCDTCWDEHAENEYSVMSKVV